MDFAAISKNALFLPNGGNMRVVKKKSPFAVDGVAIPIGTGLPSHSPLLYAATELHLTAMKFLSFPRITDSA